MLLLETGMLGVFVALDLFLFYIFWEVMLIPMYFLIGIWGGPRRVYAAIKFFLYTLAGSAPHAGRDPRAVLPARRRHRRRTTFDLPAPRRSSRCRRAHADAGCSSAFALAFAIKVPMFPFHTWLPDAHVEAPTAGSVILAGVLLKMGTYGFLRFCHAAVPATRALSSRPWIVALAVIGIIYGALVRHGADGHQEARRVLLGQPPGLRACSGCSRLTPEGMRRRRASR